MQTDGKIIPHFLHCLLMDLDDRAVFPIPTPAFLCGRFFVVTFLEDMGIVSAGQRAFK